MGKSYIELWNVVAVPNSNLSQCASMYRIKPERIINFFLQNEFLYDVQHQEQKNTAWKRNCKNLELIWDSGIKYFVKKKNIRRNIMKLEKKNEYQKENKDNKFLSYNVKHKEKIFADQDSTSVLQIYDQKE